ncbi:MAG: DUF721 domain-containing protein [Planctomycetota bacterium]
MSFGDTVSYQGSERGNAREYGEVLKKLLKSKRFFQKNKYGALSKAWKDVVGDEIAGCTKIVSYEHGCLRVEVMSSVLLQELSGFMKESILQELQQHQGGEDVCEIRFCMGSEN